MEEKKQRGGLRNGSGRKPNPNKGKAISIYFSPSTYELVRELGRQKHELIEALLVNHFNKKNDEKANK